MKPPRFATVFECVVNAIACQQVTLTLADEENTLKAGDAVTLPARAPRRWENRTKEIAEILMVSSR